ncbi:hypothetical protein Vadar_004770 [Vaccinium darrowii]|uniref:Uncharacterized protein n=1 Tax=Vaccinium darrowii TaxID=229202 RepID=A0ACB7YBJ0_9ERIC|nr:hypothetical protein Vadar_004770 [Vaccinium darrowii]
MAAADMEEDECELFNDDGFVYKRKKRPALDPTAAPPPPDPAAEENFRGRMKKRARFFPSFPLLSLATPSPSSPFFLSGAKHLLRA